MYEDDDDDDGPAVWDADLVRRAMWVPRFEDSVRELFDWPYSAMKATSVTETARQGIIGPDWLHDEFQDSLKRRPDEDSAVRMGQWIIEARTAAIAANAMAVSAKAGEDRRFAPKELIKIFESVPVLEARGPFMWLVTLGFMIRERLVKRSWKTRKGKRLKQPFFRLTKKGHGLATYDSQRLMESPDLDLAHLTDELRENRDANDQATIDEYYQRLADKRKAAEGES